jgi:hypothetical protein
MSANSTNVADIYKVDEDGDRYIELGIGPNV